MKMRQLLIGACASILGCIGTSAFADGMVGSVAAPCCEAPFAGLYVGGTVGYANQKVDVDNYTIVRSFDDKDGGVTFGGYVGYNWQACCSPFVFGVEADFNFNGAKPTAYDIEPGVFENPTETTSLESRIDFFGTLRARLGYVIHDNVLVYATGGLAYADVKHELFDDCVGCGNSSFNFGPYGQTNSGWKAGWTVGGGTEFLHDRNWVFRAEALYVDLGSSDVSYVFTTPEGTANADTKWNDNFWTVRLGVSYLFGGRDEAVPLK
jgi:outer membrane immunogenic protein